MSEDESQSHTCRTCSKVSKIKFHNTKDTKKIVEGKVVYLKNFFYLDYVNGQRQQV